MLSYELSEKVTKYLDKEISLSELEEWIVPRLPIFLQSPQSSDAEVISAFELGLAEMTDSIRTEDEFRKLLQQALSEQSEISFQQTPVVTQISASNSITELPYSYQVTNYSYSFSY